MKKCHLVIIVTIILFSISLSASAQSNYRSGYIITNEKDTIYGLIDYRTDARNATVCTFKVKETDSETSYYPNDILGYRFTLDGKYYVSRAVTINNTIQNIFLEYLVKGMMNLYFLDSKDQRYFFFEKDGVAIEFTKVPNYTDRTNIISDNRYKQNISQNFSEYPSVLKEIKKMDFNRKSFINIAKAYHAETCTTGEKCVIFENKKPEDHSVKLKISAYAGMYLNEYTVVKEGEYDLEINSSQAIIGGKFSLYNPRWSKSFAMQADLSLTKLNGSNSIFIYNGIRQYDLDAILLRIKVGAEYKFLPSKKLQPSLGVGGASPFFLNNKSLLKYVDDPANRPAIKYALRKAIVGYYVCVGIHYSLGNSKEIFLQGSMEKYPSNDNIQKNGADRFGAYSIIVGYTF